VSGACEAWAEVVAHRRQVAQLPQVERPYALAALARALARRSGALDAVGESAKAEAAGTEARRIWSELSLPGSPG
jgi:hypothetical protein